MSLQEQLSALTGQDGTVLDRNKRKKIHGVSLIYETNEAAAQDFETIFEASLEALLRLQDLDPRFRAFRTSLFAESSIGVDRHIQTTEQNRLLDRAVDEFLALVAPRIQLDPAVVALEWLVRRFQIHVYNAESLLLTVLPYYSAPVFVRVLSIIQNPLPPVFSFLERAKKSVSSPSRNLLVRALAADAELRSLIQNQVVAKTEAKLDYQTLLAFWSSTTVWTMVAMKEAQANDDDILAVFLPSVSSLISQTHSAHAQTAAYMVLSVLATQFSLAEDVAKAAVKSVALGWTRSSMSSGVSCITQLVKNMGYEPFEARVWEALTKVKGLTSQMTELGSKYDVDRFVAIWALSMIKYEPNQNSVAEVVSMLVSLDIGQESLIEVAVQATKWALEDSKTERQWLVGLFEFLYKSHRHALFAGLKASGYSLDRLELALQKSICQGDELDQEQNDNDDDVEMDESNSASPDDESASNLDELFLALEPSNVASFLCLEADNDFLQRLTPFSLASTVKRDNKNLLTELKVKPESVPTFLARVWCSPYAVVVKAAALGHIIGILEQTSAVDYQGLIPSLLVTLTDHSETVRTLGARAFTALSQRYPLSKPRVWALESLYGSKEQTDMAKWLGSDDLTTLLSKVLMPRLQECVMDREYVYTLFGGAFETSKKSFGMALASFLASHVEAMPFAGPKLVLLRLLNRNGKNNAKLYLAGLLSGWLGHRSQLVDQCSRDRVSFNELETQVLSSVGSVDRAQAKLLETYLRSGTSLATITSARLVALWPSLKLDVQVLITKALVDAGVDEDSAFDPMMILDNVKIDSAVFVQLLASCKLDSNPAQSGAPGSPSLAKRRRRSSASRSLLQAGGPLANYAEQHLRRLTLVLEILDRSSPAADADLLPELFANLAEILVLGADANISVAYTQQVAASCLIGVVSALKSKRNLRLDSRSIRVDTVVSCLRTSSSPQVQNRFLLLISHLAALAPEVVLHSVMPIFTFMGANTLRQDDDFSAHVIQQTIEQVVPALANSNSGDQKDSTVDFLLLSFVAAFPHVPRHRRVKLFSALIRTLGVKDNLPKLLVLLGFKYADARGRQRPGDAKALAQFGSTFMASFPASEEVSALGSYLNLVNTIPWRQLDPKEFAGNQFYSQVRALGDKTQVVDFKAYLYDYLASVVSGDGDKALRVLVWRALTVGDNSDGLAGVIKSVVQVAVSDLLTNRTKAGDNALAQAALLELLQRILELLPLTEFVDVALALASTKSTEVSVQCQTLRLLGVKFEVEVSDEQEAISAAGQATDGLLSLVRDAQTLELAKVAIDGLDTVVAKFGARLSDATLKAVLEQAVSVNGLLSPDTGVFVSAVALCGSITTVLGAKMIGYFGRIVPVVFRRCTTSDSVAVRLATFALMAGMVKRIPAFMTSSLDEILGLVFVARVPDERPRNGLVNTLIASIPEKDLLQSLANTWSVALSTSFEAVALHLDTVDKVVRQASKKTVSAVSGPLVRFLLETFSARASGRYDANDCNRIESRANACGLQVVLKLNDKTFRPLFLVMVRWAIQAEGPGASDVPEHARLLVFFKFFNKLLSSLKTIVAGYYAYVLDAACDVVVKYSQATSSDQDPAMARLNTALVRTVLGTLMSAFEYAEGTDFWQTQARFEKVTDTLTSLLAIVDPPLGPVLVKALVSLGEFCCSSADHYNYVNEKLCEHVRGDCSLDEKLLTIRVLTGYYDKASDEWDVLAQQLPLISELLEDDLEEVEKAMRGELIPAIERNIGESVDRYLN